MAVTAADFRGLRKLREASAKRWAGGVVLYEGETNARASATGCSPYRCERCGKRHEARPSRNLSSNRLPSAGWRASLGRLRTAPRSPPASPPPSNDGGQAVRAAERRQD